jgi:ABC-type transporter Mla subunit MlaD
MDFQKNDATIGAFVLGTLVVFGLAAVTINRGRFFSKTEETYPLFIKLPQIVGIEKGVDVMYEGYKAGSVDDIRIAYEPKLQFIVRLAIKKEIELHEGANVVVRNRGFAGGKYLEVSSLETGKKLKSGDTLPTVLDTDIMSKASEAMGEVQMIFKKLQQEGTPADIALAVKRMNSVLAKLDVTLDNLNGMLAENREPFKTTMAHASTASKDLPSIVGDAKDLMADLKRHPWRLLRKGDVPPPPPAPAEKKP